MSESKIIYSKTFDITKSNSITIQLSNFNGKDLLNIYKSSFSDRYTGIVKNNSIAFSLDQVEKLYEILKNISGDNEVKEYGNVGKYKIFTSTFKGNNNFQIREWIESESYTGYGKKGISISIDNFQEFYDVFQEVFDNIQKYIKGELEIEEKKSNDDDIESFF